jgi:hypothetical protein
LAHFDASRRIARTGLPASRSAFDVAKPTLPVAPTIANILKVMNWIRWEEMDVDAAMLWQMMSN